MVKFAKQAERYEEMVEFVDKFLASMIMYKVGISRMKAYRAKAEAIRMIEGSVAEQYAMLWDYCHELEDKNPGSTTKMQYAYHLKGVYGGQLLTAVGIDPNNETWVLAYVVVEMETKESWTWFIDLERTRPEFSQNPRRTLWNS
ncbi:hypothetical protein L3X38_043243 [Prunus dulcis]|uniref:MULE transposase domain-containing protein n=1 Tax=Prunus dulcis TaxID=3755 RepID=A0AAD4UY33_PRUDU|nr:hypothetical protein L3X38_043243 [Prunus dulcis]